MATKKPSKITRNGKRKKKGIKAVSAWKIDKNRAKPAKKVKPEPIESEQEVEFDGHDVEDDFGNSACLDELYELDDAQEEI